MMIKVFSRKKSRLQNELMGIEDLNLSNLDLENVNDTVQPGNDNEDKNTSIYNTNNQLEKQLSYVEQSEEYDDLTKVSAGKDVNYPLTPGAEMETLSFIEDSDDSLQDPDFVVEQEISNTDYDESIIYGLENSDSANFERELRSEKDPVDADVVNTNFENTWLDFPTNSRQGIRSDDAMEKIPSTISEKHKRGILFNFFH
ncbi:hypothetical protein HHI36_008094 [Cryptolaemus montrouzieri]|uniref:Uncharacterized protein n=1 Tax=Cryptolaemus montrouzieri TaxID=559131 RepID=A0ABD2MRJ1_9CUCU